MRGCLWVKIMTVFPLVILLMGCGLGEIDTKDPLIVGHGIDGDNLYYSDPWYGEGKKIALYDWVKSNSEKNWTSTVTIDSDIEPTPTPTPEPTLTPEPTHPPIASCSNSQGGNYCGQKSPDGCWCDDMCSNYGDCCADKTQICGS